MLDVGLFASSRDSIRALGATKVLPMRFMKKLASMKRCFLQGVSRGDHLPGRYGLFRQKKGTRKLQEGKELESAEEVFTKCRCLFERGHFEEARTLIAERLPEVPLGNFADIGAHLLGRVWQSRLDTKRGIIWAVGDTGTTLAITLAYPYDLHGNHLLPTVVAEEPGSAWWGYRGEPPIGLGLRDPDADARDDYTTLVDAPGDGILVFKSSSGCVHAINYNGSHVRRISQPSIPQEESN